MEEFLRLVLPESGYYFSITFIGRNHVHKAFTDIPALAANLEEASQAGFNSYYAVAAYKEPYVTIIKDGQPRRSYRKKTNVRVLRVQHADIDVGPDKPYKTLQEAMEALKLALAVTGLPTPNIVRSGNGLHLYWAIIEELLASKWATASAQFKKIMTEVGLELDSSRTSDEASILRAPGTFNYKDPQNPKPVKWIVKRPRISYEEFLNALEAAAKKLKIKAPVAPKQKNNALLDALDGGISREAPPADSSLIADKCTQLAECRQHRGDVVEPLWYLMLGTLAFCQDGERFAHEWSKGFAGYSATETQQKFEQWQGAVTGGATCAKWEKENPIGCRGCAYKGKINSPLKLGIAYEEVSHTPATEEEKETGAVPDSIPPPYPFKRTTQGLVCNIEEDVPYCFLRYDLYIKDIVTTALGESAALIAVERPLEGWDTFTTPLALFAKPDKLSEYFFSKRIILKSKQDVTMLTQYCNSYMEELQRVKHTVKGSRSFGWQEDGSFVLGEYVIFKDGSMRKNPSLTTDIPLVREISHKGSAKTWVELTKHLDTNDMSFHAFALLCGFAAPLFRFTNYGGAAVNLVGRTGVGKSTMQRMINSIWGNPDGLMLTEKDTDNAKMARMGYMNNLPVCIEEMGNMQADRLSTLILRVTQGSDVRRLRQDGKERETRTWNTIAVTSSNHAFVDKLKGYKSDTEAELMRLLECRVLAPEYFAEKENADQFNTTIIDNYGKVGLLFIKQLVQIQDTLPERIRGAAKKMLQNKAQFSTQERYWEAVLACCYVAGGIAKDLGLIRFDYRETIHRVAEHLQVKREEYKLEIPDWMDVLARFTNRNVNKTLAVRYFDNSNPVVVREPRGNGLVVRIEQRFKKSETVRAEMMIDYYELQLYLSETFTDIRLFKEALEANGVLLTDNAHRSISKGSELMISPTRVLILDLLQPAMAKLWDNYQPPDDKSVLRMELRREKEENEVKIH